MKKHVSIEKRLSELGHTQDLRRKLHVWHVVSLALANISPTVVVVVFAAAILGVGGTFAVGANLLIALIVIPIALCLAELGAMYPLTGGVYSLARRVLPGPVMWITAFNVLTISLVFLAISSLAIAPFLKSLVPALQMSDQLIAVITLAIATAIALVRVELGAMVNVILIVVESIALGTIMVAGLSHPHQPLAEIIFHPSTLDGSQLSPVTIGVMLATMPGAFSMIAGYESVLGFSEELIGNTKTLVKAVVATALLAIALIIVPLILAVVAAPDLTSFFQSETPITYAVQQSLGEGPAKLISVCIIAALFTSMVATFMYYSRIFYATGRDKIWSKSFSRHLSTLNKHKVPGRAVLIMSVISLGLIFVSALNWLVIFLGACLTTMYFVVGFAGFWSRFKFPNEVRPYRMPLWPLFPVAIMLFTAFAYANQERQHLIGSVVLDLIAVTAWVLHTKFRKKAD